MSFIKQKEYQQQSQSQAQLPSHIQVQILFEQPPISPNSQLILAFALTPHLHPQTSQLCLKSFLFQLVQKYNISIQNKEIHFYLESGDVYMNCGVEPISQFIRIDRKDFQGNKHGIKIKIKKIRTLSILHKLMAVDNPQQNFQQTQKDQFDQNLKSRRTKQRRIGYIIQKVIEWRNYYSGTTNQHKQQMKLSLQDAAKQVNISKKSLDDYLFQIRFGHRYGFNFNQHYNEKVGVLRDFVRQKKKTDKTQTKHKKNKKKIQHHFQ